MTKLSPDATLRQGGDLRGLSADRSYLDLGTCVNRYGPPPSVAAALQELDITRLRPHPYDAEQMFVSAYAEYLGVRSDELVARHHAFGAIDRFSDRPPRRRHVRIYD